MRSGLTRRHFGPVRSHKHAIWSCLWDPLATFTKGILGERRNRSAEIGCSFDFSEHLHQHCIGGFFESSDSRPHCILAQRHRRCIRTA